jgi:hypothetical protein
MLRPTDLVALALRRLDYAETLFGPIEIIGSPAGSKPQPSALDRSTYEIEGQLQRTSERLYVVSLARR